MSEEKKERTVESIHQDYSRLCAQAGHTQYQIQALKKDLDLINSQLRDLNMEAVALSAKTAASVSPPPAETI